MRVLCNMAEIIQLLWEEPIEIKVGQRGGDRARRARFLTKAEAFFLSSPNYAYRLWNLHSLLSNGYSRPSTVGKHYRGVKLT
jgi:hypothetical protein